MFRDEAIQKAINWNLRRCRSAKKILKIVKKDLQYKAIHSEYHLKEGYVQLNLLTRLSQKGFTELQEMCQKEGIIFPSNWESPFPDCYCFKLKIR